MRRSWRLSAEAARRADDTKAKIDLYGFAMLDMGYDFNQNDPDWFDVMRPTKLPAFENEFGKDGRFYSGVQAEPAGRQELDSHEGRGDLHDLRVRAVRNRASTPGRRRSACGTPTASGNSSARARPGARSWIADVFPNSVEYWGPNGMVFFRNVQIRYMPLQGDNEVVHRPRAPRRLGRRRRRIGPRRDCKACRVASRLPTSPRTTA